MKSTRYFFAVFACATTCLAQERLPSLPSPSDRTVAVEHLHSQSNERTLTLYEREVPEPTTAAMVRYSLYTKPPSGAGSNRVLYLVESTGKSGQESILWVAYVPSKQAMLQFAYHAALLTPLQGSLVHVVLAKQLETTATFIIYEVDPAKQVASFPLQFDPERKEEWPQPSKPVSELTYKTPKAQALAGCVVTSIDLAVKNESISIRAQRKPRSCGSLLTTFDLRSVHWSDVEVHGDNDR